MSSDIPSVAVIADEFKVVSPDLQKLDVVDQTRVVLNLLTWTKRELARFRPLLSVERDRLERLERLEREET